jgi:hypothetical protein
MTPAGQLPHTSTGGPRLALSVDEDAAALAISRAPVNDPIRTGQAAPSDDQSPRPDWWRAPRRLRRR